MKHQILIVEDNEINRKTLKAMISDEYRILAASLINLRETAAMVNQFKRDRLTGLFTKEFFYQTVRQLLEAYPDKEFNLTCSNIENFKLYNDTYGRKAGDELLKEAAAD